MRQVQLSYRTAHAGHHHWRRTVKRLAFPVFSGTLAIAAGIVLGNLGS